MGGQLDSKIGEVGGQLHRELGKLVKKTYFRYFRPFLHKFGQK